MKKSGIRMPKLEGLFPLIKSTKSQIINGKLIIPKKTISA